jgi:hypothetical protein
MYWYLKLLFVLSILALARLVYRLSDISDLINDVFGFSQGCEKEAKGAFSHKRR